LAVVGPLGDGVGREGEEAEIGTATTVLGCDPLIMMIGIAEVRRRERRNTVARGWTILFMGFEMKAMAKAQE
jgi:hypothetical protein